MRIAIVTLLSLSLSYLVSAQDQVEGAIFLLNPSFEDLPRPSGTPRGWTNCGWPEESPPDVQPDPRREFDVVKGAVDGRTYLGMVARDNETYERVGQQLSMPMEAGQCYDFRIQLARSEIYMSKSRITNLDANYVTPLMLRVYAGYSACDRREELGRTALVDNFDWREFRLKFKPTENYTHIVLEAHWKQPILFPYNGNLLLDDIQPIVPMPCEEDIWAPDEPLVADATPPVNPDENIRVTPVRPRNAPEARQPENRATTPPAAAAPTVRLGRTQGMLKKGQIFFIDQISFKANSADIEQDSQEALAEIVNFLRANDGVIVEIGGHASYRAGPTYAERISNERARAVVAYLEQQNVGRGRVFPKGYGKSRPVYIDDTPECNERNQRVELKILKTD